MFRRCLMRAAVACLVFLPGALVLAQGAKVRAQDTGEIEREDAPAARENWFRMGRQSPDERPAAEHLQGAFQQKLRMRVRRASRPYARVQNRSASMGSVLWSPMGPSPIVADQFANQDYGPMSGRATAVAVSPADPSGNTVLLGGAFGGAWLSHNATAADPRAVTWQGVLDQQPSLAVGSAAFSPDGGVMLVGTGEGNSTWDSYYGVGFLRSTDGGSTWVHTAESSDGHSFRGLAIQRIAWSKTSPLVVAASTMFAARTSNSRTNSTTQGVYYSQDGGITWQLARVFEDADETVMTAVASSHSVVWNPADHRFYAQFRYHGIYVSKPDDASSFHRLQEQPDGSGVGTLNDASLCNAYGGSCPMFRGEIAVNPKRNEIYVWWIQYPATHKGIWKSSDSGASWTRLNDSGFTGCGDSNGCGASQSFYNMSLLAIPNAAHGTWTDLFVGSVNVYKCTIDAATAANANCGGSAEPFRFMNLTHVYGSSTCTPGKPAHVHPDQHAMASAENSSVLYFAHDGGISRTLASASLKTASCSATQPFDNLNDNFGSMTEFVWGVAIPNDTQGMLAGSQDNGTAMTYTGAPVSRGQWLLTNGGDGGYVDIDPVNPTRWFASNNDVSIQSCGLGTACNRTTWGSNTSADLVGNADTGGDESSFYAPWMLDPQKSTSLLVGTCRIWRGPTRRVSSTQWGGAAISPMLNYTGTCGEGDPKVSAIAAGGAATAVGSKVIWAGLENGSLWRTMDATVAPMPEWEKVTPPGAPYLRISSVALDPHDASGRTAFVAYQGFGTSHLWRTLDGGASWSPAFASSGLPDAPYNYVLVDPDDGGTLYVATDVGLFACEQAGETCEEVGPAAESGSAGYLPNVPVMRVIAQKVDGRKLLKAVTYGRGAWVADLSANGDDFAISQAAPASATLGADGSASFTLSISPTAGSFNSAVTFGCGDLPAGVSCSFSPATVNPGAQTVSTTLTIRKTATNASGPGPRLNLAWMGVVGLALAVPRKKLLRSKAGGLCLLLMIGLCSCGGPRGGTSSSVSTPVVTGRQTYLVTVSATSGTIQHSTQISVTVE